MDSHYIIQTAEVDFRACQSGENPTTVLLHGFGADLHTWDSLCQAMQGSLPVLRYDLRGFGESIARPVAGKESTFSHTDDLLRLLDTVGMDSVDLIGASMGGGVALNFALEHPQRVRNLVLISPALVAWEWSQEWRALWRPIVEFARMGKLDEARQLWWQHPLFDSTRASAGRDALYAAIMRFSGDQWVSDNQRHALPDVDRIHLLKTRTLLLTGGRDMADFRLIADLLVATADDLQRIDSPDLGHLLHMEDAASCARSILSFLR
jgi:pimeloyl-ACP methyl ester carboxylesterase